MHASARGSSDSTNSADGRSLTAHEQAEQLWGACTALRGRGSRAPYARETMGKLPRFEGSGEGDSTPQSNSTDCNLRGLGPFQVDTHSSASSAARPAAGMREEPAGLGGGVMMTARNLVAAVSRSSCPPPPQLSAPPLPPSLLGKSAAGQRNTDERQPLAPLTGNSLKHNWVSWRNAEGSLVMAERQQCSGQGDSLNMALLLLLPCYTCQVMFEK